MNHATNTAVYLRQATVVGSLQRPVRPHVRQQRRHDQGDHGCAAGAREEGIPVRRVELAELGHRRPRPRDLADDGGRLHQVAVGVAGDPVAVEVPLRMETGTGGSEVQAWNGSKYGTTHNYLRTRGSIR